MEQYTEMDLQISELEPDSTTKAPLTFDDLPVEMMAEIFKHLDPKERQKMRTVSRSWKDAISNLFEIELHIQNSNLETMLKTESSLISVVIPDAFVEFDRRFQQMDSFCSRLQKVEFCGTMFPDNFFVIIGKCESLKTLSLYKVIPTTVFEVPTLNIRGREVSGSEVDSKPNWLPVLTSLRFIPDDNIHRSRCDLQRQQNLIQLVANLLENGKLSKLEVDTGRWELYSAVASLMQDSPKDLSIQDSNYVQTLKRLITSNRSTLKLLKITSHHHGQGLGFQEGLMLQLSPHLTDTNSTELRIEGLTGTLCCFLQCYPKILPAMFDRIISQDGLKKLDLKFYGNKFATTNNLVQKVEEATSQIIRRNAVSLDTLGVYFYRDRRANNPIMSYSGVLSSCFNLASLTIMHSTTTDAGEFGDPLPPVYPTFTGIGQLPPNLKYFSTNFSLGMEANGLDELKVPNLSNLKTFVWSANPWFVFNGIHSTPMSIDDFQVLLSKLPALKTVQLKLGNYPKAYETTAAGNSTMGMRATYTDQTVTPELLQMFECNIVEQAQFPYLKLYFP